MDARNVGNILGVQHVIERHRSKDERRHRLFAFKGNAWVIEQAMGPTWLVRHPNRLLIAFRSSNKSRRAA